MITHLIGAVHGYLCERHSVRQLLRCSDRDLEDVGLTRGDVLRAASRRLLG